MFESLSELLPWVLAILPIGAPFSGGLGVDLASLAALRESEALPEACPQDMSLVDGNYCPALNYECRVDLGTGESARCGEYARKGACVMPLEARRFCVDLYEWPNVAGENPQVDVTWFQAKELCAKAGKRLCRRSEWMLACEGPKRLPYPYGHIRQPSPCNLDRGSIPFDLAALLNPATRDEEVSRLWQADPVGSHPACVSPFGAYDMSGNVDEWTDNQADDPRTAVVSTLNGGYWGPVRDTCRLTTWSHGPSFRFYQVGFRCCTDAMDGIQTPPVLMHRAIPM